MNTSIIQFSPQAVTVEAPTRKRTKPAAATHMIVAELMEDDSDIQTDYFASHSTRAVFLAWSNHGRDLFSEMRKAAATFAPTAHMAPGCDQWTARVVFKADNHDAGQCYWKGSYAPWHRDMSEDESGNLRTFSTEAEARAFAAMKGEPHPIHLGSAETAAEFEWHFSCESYEHREKWSMGSGYYLGGKYSGWKVSKMQAGKNAESMPGPSDYEEPAQVEEPTSEPTAPAADVPATIDPVAEPVEFPQKHELIEAAKYAASILAKIPAFGDSIGKNISKAQIGVALDRLTSALSIA